MQMAKLQISGVAKRELLAAFESLSVKVTEIPKYIDDFETVILNEWTTFRCFKKPAAPELFERFSNEKLVGLLYEYDFF